MKLKIPPLEIPLDPGTCVLVGDILRDFARALVKNENCFFARRSGDVLTVELIEDDQEYERLLRETLDRLERILEAIC